MEYKFRTLKPDEIELRASKVKSTGFGLLLYKTARTDQDILDEEVGPMGWQRDHKELKENMYCGIGIYDKDTNQWVWKWDAGAESYSEKEKGEASDSFKRAGFNWGIGRELYTSPFIWIMDKSLIESYGEGKDIKYRLKNGTKLYVSDIQYNEKREIIKLTIKNKENVIWMFGYTKKEEDQQYELQPITFGLAQEIRYELDGSKYTEEQILNKYDIDSLFELNIKTANAIIKGLKES